MTRAPRTLLPFSRIVSSAVLAAFAGTLFPIRAARADEDGRRASETAGPLPTAAPAAVDPGTVAVVPPAETEKRGSTAEATSKADLGKLVDGKAPEKLADPRLASGVAPPAATTSTGTLDLPSGGAKTGVSSQAIAVPKGSGKIEGMGESFSAQLSTGIASFAIPFRLFPARGAAEASLGLSYSSSGGHGAAGVGWEMAVPFIARQTDRGLPHYDDQDDWHPEQDHFVFGGGQELVPICKVSGTTCAGATDEIMPDWANDWQYFRVRVEGAFQRFFWSPDHRTWRVQDKSGVLLELGGDAVGAIETKPGQPSHIFRWNIGRQLDAQGTVDAPVNQIVYRYIQDGGIAYLSDIYATPPAANAATAPVSAYARHARVRWQERPDPKLSFRRGYRTDVSLRLAGVDVTSATFVATGHRQLDRRYHLRYDGNFHVSLLDSVQMEGRCESAISENDQESLPTTSCPTLPAMAFGYQHVQGFGTDGAATNEHLTGYEPFDARLRSMTTSPPHSLDEELSDLFDVNADGLPDVVSTAPGIYAGKHGLFLNGAGKGTADAFGSDTMCVKGVLGADANVITLKNQNLSVQDLDGDGTIDFLHMPKAKTYSVYTPTLIGKSYCWVGREIAAAGGQAPAIDFGKDADRVSVVDVNGDGLVDVLRITGTEVQTYFALGRYAGGDGNFGHAKWLSPTQASLSTTAVTSCVPWAGQPVQLEDKQVRFADLNGDGLQDLVRVRKGDIQYWPGRGNGMFGTGDPSTCVGGGFGQDRHIKMAGAPQELSPTEDAFRLDDVNGDGLDDLVQIRFDAVDVWLNVDGTSWTPKRFILDKTPVSLPFANRVRVVDINGSGTRDLLWGDGNNYRYMDLAEGKQPWLLTSVANGLGKTTELTYASSTELMLAATKEGKAWKTTAPMPLRVVIRKVERDHLDVVGRPEGKYITEYTYRDPLYDGRQREFRGFEQATVRSVGDANSPTSLVRSRFLLGGCKDTDANDGVDACSVSERWRDNSREALKGLPVTEETMGEDGTTLSTTHHTYTNRVLRQGRDGRAVQHAFESKTDQFLYDLAPFAPSLTNVSLVDVVGDPATTVVLAAAAGRVHLESEVVVDLFGNRTESIAHGCTEGCDVVDETITSHTVPGRREDEPSGWMWRTTATYITGSVDTGARKRLDFTYDLAGQLETSTMLVEGSLVLPRYRMDTFTFTLVPSDPTDATVDGPVLVQSISYDPFGNAGVTRGANGRCAEVLYDGSFAELPVAETIFAGTVGPVETSLGTFSCGTTHLTSAVGDYDRGFGLARVVQDLHSETTTVAYDGFRRLTALYKPDATTLGESNTVPSVKVTYDLPTDATKRPYALLHTETQDGTDDSIATYQDAWAYVDGMGRTLVTLQEADPTGGDGGAWVVNGLADWDAKGSPRRAYLAWYKDSDPETFSLSTVPPTAYGRQRYDAFGRAVQLFGLDGTVTLQTRFHALSTDSWDAADLAPGPHHGTYASTLKDGHGRLRRTTERLRIGAGTTTELVATTNEYLTSGALRSIYRTSDYWGSLFRWMRYDSQDRMVMNVDQHTTLYFQSDPTADPYGMGTWKYAYSDSGDLVGTSDARFCGQNFYYDAAGRTLAEDYSPCLPHHPDYTPVNLATGEGAEVFYRYDAVDPDAEHLVTSEDPSCAFDPALSLGRVTSLSDRAQKTWTAYDARGRATCLAKRLAPPGPAAADLEDRYTGRVYTQTVTFDGADRPVDVTTGVRTAALLGTGDASFVVSPRRSPRPSGRRLWSPRARTHECTPGGHHGLRHAPYPPSSPPSRHDAA